MSGPVVHDYLIEVRTQLRSFLAASFPQYRFSLLSTEAEGMGFVVVPVVGYVNGEDRDLAEPDAMALTEIRFALEAFRPSISVH